MAQDSWYYKRLEEEANGPISFEELFAMAHAGELTPQMDVRNGEAGNWFPAEEIGGLFEAAAESEGSALPSLDDFSIVESSFGMPEKEPLPTMEGFSIVEDEDKLTTEMESQLPRFATLEAVRNKRQNVQWFCRILNQELGPMSTDDLMQLLFDGELAPNDEVRSSAEPEWVPARTVVFLSSAGGDLDVIDAESEEAEQVVPATGEVAAKETATEEAKPDTAEASEKKEEPAPAEPPQPPILKVRSRQKWYCKLGGMGYGPIEAHKIKMWAEQERVEPTDLLKLGKRGEWFEAWQIEALQLKKPAPQKPETEETAPEKTDSSAAASATPDTKPETAAAAPPPPMPAAPPPPPPTAAPAPAKPKPKIKVARSNPFEALGPMMDPKILGGIAGVIALVAILFFVPLGGLFSAGGKDELVKFQTVHQEFLALQKKQASEAEWDAFEKKTKTELAPILKELESTAGSDKPQLQYLLWAGRDYLPLMLDNARTEPSPDQEKYEKYLQEAEQILKR